LETTGLLAIDGRLNAEEIVRRTGMQRGNAAASEDSALVIRRRRQIVDAATTLFSKQGYFRTTIKEVAALAGVSPGLVYQYVSDKDDLLFFVLQDVVDAYAKELPIAIAAEVTPLGRLRAAIGAYCRIVANKRAATLLAYRSTKALPEDKQEMIQRGEIATNAIITDVLAECRNVGLLKSVNLDLLTYRIVMTAHTWALKSWRLKTICTLDEYIDESVSSLLEGVLTQRGLAEMKVDLAS
jgi:AcrR family transcriptional regulator